MLMWAADEILTSKGFKRFLKETEKLVLCLDGLVRQGLTLSTRTMSGQIAIFVCAFAQYLSLML